MVSWLAQLSRALVVRASPRAGQRRRASRRGRRPPPTGAEVVNRSCAARFPIRAIAAGRRTAAKRPSNPNFRCDACAPLDQT